MEGKLFDKYYIRSGEPNIYYWQKQLFGYYATVLNKFYFEKVDEAAYECYDDYVHGFVELFDDAQNQSLELLMNMFDQIGYTEENCVLFDIAIQNKMKKAQEEELPDDDRLHITIANDGQISIFNFVVSPLNNEEDMEF